ncbi:MAG: DHH family phosphoesterase, partial [Turicibacter sp.]
LNVVKTSACATSELVIEIYEANKDEYELDMCKEAAELLYTGIIADSGRFLYDNTSKETLMRVATLFDYSIDRKRIHDDMYRRQMNIIKAQGFVLSQFKVSNQGVAYFKMTKDQQAEFDLTTATRSSLVNVLANIEGIHIWVCFFENDENIRVNIRSGGPIINVVAERFEGGGHPKASGAIIYDWESCVEVIQALDEACLSYLNEQQS